MNIKRILGFAFLFAFVGYMGKKLLADIGHLNDDWWLIGFILTVVLLLVFIVRRILFS